MFPLNDDQPTGSMIDKHHYPAKFSYSGIFICDILPRPAREAFQPKEPGDRHREIIQGWGLWATRGGGSPLPETR
jgi:hypothetical protein